MTSGEMMKKIGLKKDDGNLKGQTLKYLKEGKEKLLLLERHVMAGKNGKKLQAGIELSKKKLISARKTFTEYEKKAEAYIEQNPKKAVAIAAAAGVLAGSLWSAIKGNKRGSKPALKLVSKKTK